LIYHRSIYPSNDTGLKHVRGIALTQRKKMEHLGQLLATAVDQSGRSQKTVSDDIGISRSTLYRWTNQPNLDLKEVLQVSSGAPYLNIKPIFDALEEKYGHPIFENPYKTVEEPKAEYETGTGITIQIDTKKYAGYAIPPHLENLVAEAIASYNKTLPEEK
jgi:transposase